MSAKARILEHMNKDHMVSLYDFLAYYEGIKLDYSNPSHSVELVDVELDHITLNYIKNGHSKTIVTPLDPPLKSLGEARVRFVKMAFEAADAFQVSPYQIKSFHPPAQPISGIIASLFGTCAFVALSPRSVGRILQRRSPHLAHFIRQNARRIFVATIIIHLLEYFLFLRAKLDKFRVYGALRLKWFLSTMSVGFPAWRRFDQEIHRLSTVRLKFEAENP